MKNKRTMMNFIFVIAATLISGFMLFKYQGLDTHIRLTDKTSAEIIVRQTEFQKEIKYNHNLGVENKKNFDRQYREINGKISDLSVAIASIKTSQKHILKTLDKTYDIINNVYERRK